MSVYTSVRAEFVKLRHTSFWAVHIIIPILGALLFCFYFLRYENVDNVKKLKLLLELITIVFPLLISIIAGRTILQEERASYFQTLLTAPSRSKRFLAKLFVLYGAGIVSLALLSLLFLAGLGIAGKSGEVQMGLLIKAVLGIAVGSLILYVLHLFLSLKFGIGISMFCGVFETLQCIIYSNINLRGTARLIPFSWSVNLMHDSLERSGNGRELAVILALTAVALMVTLLWFRNWEGRKNYE